MPWKGKSSFLVSAWDDVVLESSEEKVSLLMRRTEVDC